MLIHSSSGFPFLDLRVESSNLRKWFHLLLFENSFQHLVRWNEFYLTYPQSEQESFYGSRPWHQYSLFSSRRTSIVHSLSFATFKAWKSYHREIPKNILVILSANKPPDHRLLNTPIQITNCLYKWIRSVYETSPPSMAYHLRSCFCLWATDLLF